MMIDATSLDPLADSKASGLPRLAILSDYVEEGWPSMDLVADELSDAILAEAPARLAVEKIRPTMRRRFYGLAKGRFARTGLNLDRFTGRFVDYPLFLRGLVNRYDVFHIADHSYAHLTHNLPAGRVGVFCHDLDAFRSLIEPHVNHRRLPFRRMAKRILDGLRKASVVFCNSEHTRQELLRHHIVPADHIVLAPLGVAAEYQPIGTSYGNAGEYLLHVGSCIPRKRVDLLLEIVARIRAGNPNVRLVQVGGGFSPDLLRKLDQLGLRDVTMTFENVTRERLAELYRGAQAVLVPSEAEGFGLPIIEALACGTRVVASDIPVLREVGGDAVTYCPVGNIDVWTTNVQELLKSSSSGPSSQLRLERAAQFNWSDHARIIVDAYETMLS